MSEAPGAAWWRGTVHAMAMPFTITADAPASDALSAAVAEVGAALTWVDDVFSLWRDDSYLSALNRGDITIDEGPPELLEVLQTCEWYRAATGGAFDARTESGLDPTGLVKGWAVDLASRALRRLGVPWMIDAAGDVLVSGPRADGSRWRIGIADPRRVGDPAGGPMIDVVELGEDFLAVATSGSAQRGEHIRDPFTGQPARHLVQASVVAGSIVDADVWATALVAGGEAVAARAVEAGMQALMVRGERADAAFDAVSTEKWPTVA